MKVMCVRNIVKNLSLRDMSNVFPGQYNYELIIGREYLVMGIALYKESNCFHYLIDSDGYPRWYPYVLFEVANHRLSKNWFMNVLEDANGGNIRALMGFKELCIDDNFHDDLISEREEYALQTYFKRKAEIFDDYFG